MKIVRFKDGTYGVRKWFFGWWYADIHNFDNSWHRRKSTYFKSWCKDTLCRANQFMEWRDDYGKPVIKHDYQTPDPEPEPEQTHRQRPAF